MQRIEEIEEIIGRYLDGKSSQDERHQLLQWIAENEENKSSFLRLKRLHDALVAQNYIVPQVETLKKKNEVDLFKFATWGLSIAASIMFLLWFGVSFYSSEQHCIASVEDIETVSLPDGSEIDLNQYSSITYSGDFERNRTVTLRGEAFFDIRSDSLNPFVVHAGNVKITVLGTRFNVLMDSVSEEVVVTVDHGIVKVESPNLEKKAILFESDRAIYEIPTKELNVEEGVEDNYLSWKTGKMQFKNSILSDVVHDLEQYYKIQIEFENDSAQYCKLTAKVEQYPLDDVLKMLEMAFNFSIENPDDNLYLIKGKGCGF